MSERKEKFTPGPWVIGRIVGFNIEIDAPNGEPDFGVAKWTDLATVYGSEDEDGGLEKGKTNAALIAAAPDMYAALEELLDSESVSIFSSAMESESWKLDLKEWEVRARSALAKARGEA